jgi:hypothetical protein
MKSNQAYHGGQMSARLLKNRLARLEQRRPTALPRPFFATRPLPEKPTRENIQRWLAGGKAHVAFNGHAIMYNGGERPLTSDEWQAKYAPRD